MQVLLTIPADAADPFDDSTAALEGWGVFDAGPDPSGHAVVQLQALPAPAGGVAAFERDEDAWAHVVAQARAGSNLHRLALAAVNDVERALIEGTCGAW